jgi:hypothetical protein
MAYGKRFDEWDRTSLLAAWIYNDAQGCRKALGPAHFNPFLNPKTQTDEPVMKITDPRQLQALVGGTLSIVT